MSQVKKYKAEVVSLTNLIDKIFRLELKSRSGRFKYLPGQFLHLALDEYDPSFGWPESRCFSMQTSPVNETVKITFSVKGQFTDRMIRELTPGKVIDIKLPYGELFQQEHDRKNVVFIAGGTGITPFLSVFNHPMFQDYTDPRLYFGVRNRTYNLYGGELERAHEINRSFITKVISEDEDGILDIDSIIRDNGFITTYFLSGPQLMISSFRSALISAGISPGQIKTDDWE